MKKVFLYQFFFIVVSLLCGYAVILIANPELYLNGISGAAKSNITIELAFAITAVSYYFVINYWWRKKQNKTGQLLRSSNVELCRVICMLGIITHHCMVHGGIINLESMTVNKFLSYIIFPWGKIGFDCFVAISCWFLVDKKFRMERFLKVWLTVLFYSVMFTLISFLMGTQMTWGNWFSVFLPIAGNSHGFAASYLAFYLLVPFLNKVTADITKGQARLLMWLFLYLETGTQIIGYIAGYYQPIPSELFVFIVCYLIALNLKRWPVKIIKNLKVCFCVFVFVWIFLWLSFYYNSVHPGNTMVGFILSTMYDESSISNIIAGFALFFFFYNIKIKPIPIINYLASGTFGILLVHDHNFFRYHLWGKVVKCHLWYDNNNFIFLAAVYAVWIFFSAYAIDCVRSAFFKKYILNSQIYRNVCDRYDKIVYLKKDFQEKCMNEQVGR